MTIGMNLGGIDDWSTDWVFVDQFKMARTWLTRTVNSWVWDSGKSAEIPLDANGWPTHLPFTASDGNQQYVHTITPAYVSGTYTVIVDGAGEIQLATPPPRIFNPAAARTLTQSPSLQANKGLLRFSWKSVQSSVSDPIRNLRVIMPGFETTYQSQPFHPLYLERLEPFTCLRFMDWGKKKQLTSCSWSDRTTAQ